MKRSVLIVSFGSSNLDAYKQVESFIKNIKDSIDKELFIQCVFTSNILIKRMKEKNNIDILNVKEALEILFNDGYKEVILQPLHMIDGKDCDSLRNILEENKDRCVVLVGHGSNRCQDNCCYTSIGINECCGDNGNVCNDDCYQEIEKALQSIGYKNVIIGTLEGSRTRSVVLKELKDKKIDDVIIMPLLVLPGNHIIKDIKGDNSWESLFNENDINVEVNLKSLLEYEKIQKLYIDMINEAINVE